MKSIWLILLLGAATFVALSVAMRSPNGDIDREDSVVSAGGGAASDRDASRPLSSSRRELGSAGSNRSGDATRSAGGAPGTVVRRHSGETASGSGVGSAVGQPQGRRGSLVEGRSLPERSLDPSRKGKDLPQDGSAGDTEAVADEDLAPEEVPEVVFDGGDRAFDTSSQEQISAAGMIAGDSGSISFWVEPAWEPQSQEDATFVQMGDNALQIVKDGDTLHFEFVDSTGNKFGGTTDISGWQGGDLRHVVGTWAGGMLALYVDGTQIFYNGAPSGPGLHGDTPIYVGSSLAGGAASAPATLSGLNILNRSMSGEEILQLYRQRSSPPE